MAPVVANGTSLVSNASIAASSAQPDSDSASVLVVSAPQLITSKSVDEQLVIPGDVVTYTITVENVGTEDATNLVISDTLPAGLELLSAAPNGVTDAATNTATWTLTDLAVGATPAVVNATARVVAAKADIVNTATVSTGTGTGQQITNPQSNIKSGAPEVKQVPTMAQWQRAILILLLMAAAIYYLRRYHRLRRGL